MDHKTEKDPVTRVPPTLAAAQQMLEYAPVAMLLVNSKGKIQHLNSAADGALSVPSGKLRIHWAVDKTTNRFQFDWQELGGPLVAPPERKGFGRIILESVVPATFVGTAELHTPPTGISWHLDAPMTAIISDM
jgi:hypothetical protein